MHAHHHTPINMQRDEINKNDLDHLRIATDSIRMAILNVDKFPMDCDEVYKRKYLQNAQCAGNELKIWARSKLNQMNGEQNPEIINEFITLFTQEFAMEKMGVMANYTKAAIWTLNAIKKECMPFPSERIRILKAYNTLSNIMTAYTNDEGWTHRQIMANWFIEYLMELAGQTGKNKKLPIP